MKWSGTKNVEYPSASTFRACSVSSLPEPHLGAMTPNRNPRSVIRRKLARRSPAAGPAVGVVEIGDFVPLDHLEALDHELGDAIAAADLECFGRVEVREEHAQLVAVSGIDEAG